MGRSSQEQALKNRERILECAGRLFRKFGVENVSVSEVMRAADMTTGGFYKHFESKDALIEEVFALSFKQASTSWLRVSERNHDDPGFRTGAIVNYYLQKKSADQACPMIAFASHVTNEAADKSSRDAYRKGSEELYSQFLAHMDRSRVDHHGPSEQEAKILFAAMVGARFLAQSTGDAEWMRAVQAAVRAEAGRARLS